MTHRTQIIYLIRLNLLNDPCKIHRIRKIAIMKNKPLVFNMRILVDVINTLRIENRRPSLDPMNNISFLQQVLRKISTILSGGACYEGGFPHLFQGFRVSEFQGCGLRVAGCGLLVTRYSLLVTRYWLLFSILYSLFSILYSPKLIN